MVARTENGLREFAYLIVLGVKMFAGSADIFCMSGSGRDALAGGKSAVPGGERLARSSHEPLRALYETLAASN